MLARIRKAMDEREEGFTLIELLVVMIIIGILAAIAIPVFLSQKQKAYETSLKSDLTNLATNVATATVDDPATITFSGTNPVTVTSNSAVPAVINTYNVPLSTSNVLDATNAVAWDPNTGAYCIGIKHGTGATATTWHVSIVAGGGQTLTKGTC